MSDIKFEDYSIQCKATINSATKNWLTECSSEVVSQASRQSRRDLGQLQGSWNYKVSESNDSLESQVGSPLENALWEEFGTGQYAANGGRQGGWYIHESKLTPKAKSKMKKVRGKNGQIFYYTKGKYPQHTLQKIFDTNREKFKARLESILKGMV